MTPATDTYKLGIWTVDPSLNEIRSGSITRRLEPRAMDVLVHLMNHAEQVISHQVLLERFWTVHTAEPRKIAKRINQIRKALEDDARNPNYIQTIHKRGYRVVAPVEFYSGDSRSSEPVTRTGAQEVYVEANALEEAYQDALSCMGLQDHRESWWSDAIESFEKVLRLQPDHVHALSYIALLRVMHCAREGDSEFAPSVEAAERALAIDPTQALPHVALGYAALLGQWDLTAARQKFERALAISADDPAILQGYYLLLCIEERYDEGLSIAQKLRRIAPNDYRYRTEVIKYDYQSRAYERAIDAATRLRRSMSGYVDMSEAAALHALGRFEDSYRARLAAYRLLGDAGEARAAILESGWEHGGYAGALSALSDYQLSNDAGTEGLVPSEFLFLPDRADQLIDVLNRDIERRRPALIGLLHHPDYDVLRCHPGMHSLLDRITRNRPPDSPAKVADVARVRVFKGEAESVVDALSRLIDHHADDERLSRWMDTMAWAHYVMGDCATAVSWADKVLDHGVGRHARAHIQFLQCASLSENSRPAEARRAFRAARQAWPGSLDFERDISPLFMGGDHTLKLRFIGTLLQVSSALGDDSTPQTVQRSTPVSG